MDEAAASRPDLQPGEPRSLDMADLGGVLTDPDLDPAVKGLTVWTANPAVTLPDTNRVRRGLCREDLFTVVLEHFMTDTARYADIVLPSTTQLEHFDVQGAWGHHYISVNHPAISPIGESRSHGEVMRALAQKIGLSDPALQESDEQIAAASLPPELSLADLKVQGWWKSPPETPAVAHRGMKWRLAGPEIESPAQPDGEALQLLTPKSHYFLNSIFANMPRQRKSQGPPALEMHPMDATKRELADGQRIVMVNDRSKVDALLRITDTVRPGVVSLEGKWWDRPTETSAVTNALSDSRRTPAGQPAYNDLFVRVIPTAP
jgi:anaerobic selenocysteine-containing dehydrogenase